MGGEEGEREGEGEGENGLVKLWVRNSCGAPKLADRMQVLLVGQLAPQLQDCPPPNNSTKLLVGLLVAWLVSWLALLPGWLAGWLCRVGLLGYLAGWL